MTRRSQAGFTLLEIMIALAILGGALVVLLSISSADIRASHKAKLVTIATELARAKMLDLEEELLRTGFQETAEEMDGDFGDEGQPRFTWHAFVEKVQLPEAGQIAAGEKGNKESTPPPAAGDEKNQAALMNLTGGSESGALGASMVQLYFPLIRPVLEAAIRKVTLEVRWKIGSDEETLKVNAFYTDAKAVDQALATSGLGALTGGGGTPSGSGNTTPGGNTNGGKRP